MVGAGKGRQSRDEAAQGVAQEVTRLLDAIRSVEVEWPLVQEADGHGTRVERLRQDEARLASELRAMESEQQELKAERESLEARKLEAVPYQEDVAELKDEVRRLERIVASEALVQETIDLLTEEQELLATQLEQAEERSHVLVAKAEELAQLVTEETASDGVLGKESLELELKRVVAEAEKAHDTIDACKATAHEQKQVLARSQIELVDAKKAAQQAQVELKDAQVELLSASSDLAEIVSEFRESEEDLMLRMDELQDRSLQVGTKRTKVAERIQAELKAIAEAEAICAKAQEEEAEEAERLATADMVARRRRELARASDIRQQQKRASSGIPAPAYQAPAHTSRKKPSDGATNPKQTLAAAPGSPRSFRPGARGLATRAPLLVEAALEAAAHEEFVPKTPGAQMVQAHLDDANAIDSPRTPSGKKLPSRLADKASATLSRQNLPSRLSTLKKPQRDPQAGPAHASGNSEGPPQRISLPDHEAQRALFDSIDVNGNGGLSLAEIDKAVVSGLLGRAMHCPSFDHKPALMRAYHAADVSHDGFIERSEFRKLLRYLVYFNNLWQKFDEIDNDHDRRLDVDEFAHGCGVLGIELSPKQARAEFARCDADGAGMVLFGEFCKWAADRHIDADAASIQERSEQEAGAAIRSRDKAEAARSTRIVRRQQALEARAEAMGPKQKRVDAGQKAVKQQREALERDRKTLLRKNAKLLKQERQLREERKEIATAQKKLHKLKENKDKLQSASRTPKKNAAQARKLKEKLATLEQAEELQSSVASEMHADIEEGMAKLREARVRFHAERREEEDKIRAICDAARVEWTMGPLPTPAEEAALAAEQKLEAEKRTSRLNALLTPQARVGAQPEEIDYDEDDDSGRDTEDDEIDTSPARVGAAPDEIDYDEDDDSEDDEIDTSPARVGAESDEIDYDEDNDSGGDTEDDASDDEVKVSAAASPAARRLTVTPLGPPTAAAAPLPNGDSDSSDDDDYHLAGSQPSVLPPRAPTNAREQPEFNSDSSSEEDV